MISRPRTRNHFFFSIIVIVSALIGGLYGCTGDGRYLTIGTAADFPPFEYIGGIEGNEIIGFDIDIARQVAALMEKQLRIIDIEYDNLLPALEAGTIDLAIAAIAITPDRSVQVDFSIPYYNANPVALVSTYSGIDDANDLLGITVGVQLGSYGETVATELTGSDNITSHHHSAELLRSLTTGAVDAVVLDQQLAETVANTTSTINIVPLDTEAFHYGIAVMKGNQRILTSINDALTHIMDTEYYERSIRHHFIGELQP